MQPARRGTRLGVWLVPSLILIACGPEPTTTLPDAGASSIAEPLSGQTGALTVTLANQVINQYAVLAADVAAGATSITVTNIGNFTAMAPFAAGLAAGDLIMIYQPQGATIDATTMASYGTVTTLGGAGNYELVHVASVAANTINLEACGGLAHAYTTAGATEVIRVPQLTTLTISGAGSVTAPAWDGARGGVVVVMAQTSMMIDGAGITATGQGFRGGAIDNMSQPPPNMTTTIRSVDPLAGAEKGEGIAGFQATYDAPFLGRYGRGAPANGGGGGDAHNAGGGGGANGDNARPWTGTGVMDGTVLGGARAWGLDPDFMTGNALTNSSGGGRGGYTFSSSDQDATMLGTNAPAWGGDHRRNVGGLGGHPVTNDPATRLFLGGGGGAGDGNDGAAGAGGRGGGLIVLIADRVSGTGKIQSNGANGVPALGVDAPGGGGAGGTIVVKATTLSGVTLQADGGAGGDQRLSTVAEAEGPGGGGGGGFIATSGGAVTQTAKGMLGGTTNSPALITEFPSNGATSGALGQTGVAVASLPICTTTDLSITKTNGVESSAPGQPTTYTIVATNNGTDVLFGATVTDTIPAALTGVTWTCTASPGSSCGAASGSGNIAVTVTLAPGAPVTFSATGTIDPAARGTLANTASVSAPSGVLDLNAGNNSATDTDTLAPGDPTGAPDEYGVRGGCGCQGGGGGGEVPSSLIVLVAAFGRRRRSRLRTWIHAITRARRRAGARVVGGLAMVLALAVAHPARAQIAGGSERFPVERMRLAIDGDGVLDVEWASVPAPLRWNVGTWLGYADDPLVIYNLRTNADAGSLVHARLGGGLFGGLGLTRWLELGLELPLIYGQTRGTSMAMLPSLVSPHLGDLRLAPKFLLRRGGGDRIGVAAMVGFTLPSGGSKSYTGDDAAVFMPELIVSRAAGAFRFSGNLGYLARSKKQVANLMVDDEIYLRVGAGYRFADRRDGFHRPLELDVMTSFSTAAASPFSHSNTNPFEVDLAAQYDVRRELTAFGVVGSGLSAGFGTPDWRVVLGVRYSMRESPHVEPPHVEPQHVEPQPEPQVEPPHVEPQPELPPTPTPTPPPAPIKDGKIVVEPVYFATDKDVIEARSHAILDNVAAVIADHPEIKTVRVEGHTDNRGGENHNQDLSQRRAAAVVTYLVGKGVARDRLDPVGFGQTRPIADNATAEGRTTNRRVEFVIVDSHPGVDVKPAR